MTAGACDSREIGSATRRPVDAWAPWLIAIALLTSSSAWALDADRRISQYGHTAWRISDGDLGAEQNGITQTRDGFLWIGTADGLLRFDGARFVRWSPPDGQNRHARGANALLGARDGSLWIGRLGHLSHWADGRLTDYPITGGVTSLLQRRNGEIWFGCAQCTGACGLFAGSTPRECSARRASTTSVTEIARALGRSTETVKAHLESVIQKLGARGRTHAVTLGLQRGIIHLDE